MFLVNKPVISAIISIRNCEAYIAECLASLEAQTFKDFEVVVVLDAPTDRTPEIVESFQGRLDIKILRNEKQMGKPWNLNRAWAAARGEFIAQIDGDDLFPPRKFEIQLAYMRWRPELGFTGTMGRYFGTKEGKITIPRSRLNCRFWIFWCASPFLHSSAMFRRETFLKAGVRYCEEIPYPEDFRLFADAVYTGIKFANIGADLYHWRQHASNWETQDRARHESLTRANQKHILATLGLPATDAGLALHHGIAGMNVPDTPEAINASLDWLVKIASCEYGKLGISRRAMSFMLRLRWAVVVFKNCVRRRSPNRRLYFGRVEGFNPLVIWRVPLWIATRLSVLRPHEETRLCFKSLKK